MKIKLNKKAFTLIEIVIAVGILAAASIGIGAIVVGVQNNSQKQFSQGDLQKQLADVQDSLKNDLLTTNAGVKYWIQDDTSAYVESDGANKNPERSKIVAMYAMDYIDNTLTRTYVKYDADTDILYKATKTESVVFDNSNKKLLDESPDEVLGDASLEWYVYAQSITNFSMDLSKYSENSTINYNVNINNESSNYKSDNTVNIRNEIPVNDATILENYDKAVVTRPSLKQHTFVYNGQVQTPKQLDVNSRYMEIRFEDSTKDKTEAKDVGKYRIVYHLKNATWDDGTTDDHVEEWEIIPRELIIKWTASSWVYDGQAHTAEYEISNVAPNDTMSTLVTLDNGTVGPNYDTKTATLLVTNPNYTIKENQSVEISITKGVAYYTTQPTPAGSVENPLTYNGQAQPLVNPGSSPCGTIQYSLSANMGFSSEIPVATSANSESPYIVYYYIKGEGSYSDSEIKYLEVVMKRAVPSITRPIPYDGVEHSTHYSGSSQNLLFSAGATSAADNAGSHLVYSLDGNAYSSTPPTGVTAKQYTIWYKSEQTENFRETEPQYVTAVILKTARPAESFTTPTPNHVEYDGNLHQLFIEGTGSATQAIGWQYKMDDTEWSYTIPQKDAAGDYKVYLKIPETNDYAEYILPDPITVSIYPAMAKFVANGDPSALPNLIYDGNPQNLIAEGLTKDGNVYYGVSITNTPPNKEDMVMTMPQGIDAGTYYVFYYIKGDSNHTDSDMGLLYATIAPAKPVVIANPIAINAPYNGNDQLLLSMQGQSSNSTPLQFSLTPDRPTTWSEVVPSGMSAGEYPVYYKIPADSNHSDSDVGMTIAYITQANTQITPPVPLQNLVYNSSLMQLCKVGDTEFGVMEYSVNSQTDWKSEVPTAVNAGTYEIYWRVQETSDYKGADGKIVVTVKKQTLGVTPPAVEDLMYNGEEQFLVSPTSGSVPNGYHFEYRMAEPGAVWDATPPKQTEAGTYFMEYRVVSTGDAVGDNIDVSAETLIIYIAPAVPEIKIEPAENLVYDGSLQFLLDESKTSTSIGELEYSLTIDGAYSTTIPWADAAGDYTVYWRTVDSDNIIQQNGLVNVTISQLKVAYPVVTPLQMSYTGVPQFPEITMDILNIDIVQGDTAQQSANDLGYKIVFELNNNSVTWIDGTTAPYTVTWFIEKGTVLEHVAPVSTPQSFTGDKQDLISPAECPPDAGTPLYRLAAFKPKGASAWTQYTETDTPWNPDIPRYSDIGEYKFLYKIDSLNYVSVPETEVLSSITKGDIQVTFTDMTLEYNGDSQLPRITPSALYGSDDKGGSDWIYDSKSVPLVQKRVKIEVSDDNGQTWKTYLLKEDPRFDSTCYQGATTPGTYTLQVRVTDTLEDYNTYTAIVDFVIETGKSSWTTTPSTLTGLVYNGQPQALLLPASITPTGAHFEYQISPATYENDVWAPSEDWSTQSSELPKETNAGYYAIKVIAVADEHYLIYSGGRDPVEQEFITYLYVEIEKAPIVLSSIPYLQNEILYYTGNAQSLGIVTGTFARDAGDSYFIYFVEYYADENSAPDLFTTSADKTINEKKGYSDTAIGKGLPKPTKKGTYIITWGVQGDSNHHNYVHYNDDGTDGSTMTAQIIAADDKTQLTGLNLAYTGRVQQIFILPSSSYTDKNIYLSADGTAWTNDATELYNMTHKTDIGTYTLYWKKGASGTQNGPVTASIQNATLSMSALQSVIANNTFNQIVFSVNMTAPAFGAFDVSAEQNGGIMAWTNNDTLCIASSAIGQKVEAPADCSNMLSGLSNVVALDLSGLDTKNTTNMSNMFKGLGENVTNHDIHIIGLSTLNTSKVANATSMFENVARNASVVYAPYFNQISFPSGATKTNWNKNFAQKATTKELGAPTEQPNGEGDTVTLDNGMVYMYAGSLHSMTIIAAQWTAQYNGTPIADITQLDYLRCTVPFQGEGVYTFEGVLKDITGTTINSHVETDVYVETEQMNADITITRNDITMYAVDMANKNIVTGTWTVTRDGEELSTNDIQIVDALTVKIPNRGNATYMFTGSLIDTSGMMYKVQIVTLVDTQGDVAYKVGDNVEMFAGSLLNEDIVAGQWVVKFNGTEITTVTQIDYLSCVIPYQGAGTYLFEGTLQNAQGEPVYSTIIQILE